jgi:hypothetical protein
LATIESLRRYTSSLRTYNLTIDNTHTYYVLAGNAPILVHNCGSGGPEDDTTSMGGRGNPFRGGAPNVAVEIGGRTYNGHVLDRMQQQGIVPAVFEDAIRGSAIPGKSAGTTACYSESNRLTVITDTEPGRAITIDYGKIRH